MHERRILVDSRRTVLAGRRIVVDSRRIVVGGFG
jgi:hypothetical protein